MNIENEKIAIQPGRHFEDPIYVFMYGNLYETS